MKNTGTIGRKIIVSAAIAFLGLGMAACTSSPANNNGGNGSTAGTVPVSLNGHWELPEGDIFFFEDRAFILFDTDGDVDFNGIIPTKTSSRLALLGNYEPRMHVAVWEITYTFLPDGNIQASLQDKNQTWINGVWKRRADLDDEWAGKISANPALGYWERKQGQEISIYHFYPDGVGSLSGGGFGYECDSDYVLEGTNTNGEGDIKIIRVEFDAELPAERLLITRKTGNRLSSGSFTLPSNYVIDGDDFVVGNARYTRHTGW